MWSEIYNGVSYPLTENGILIPDEIKNALIIETRTDLINIFIESLDIQHNLKSFISELTDNLSRYLRQEILFFDVIDSEYLREQIKEVLSLLYVEKREIFYRLYFQSQNQYTIIWGIVLNFRDILYTNFEMSHEAYIEAYNLWIISHSDVWNFLEWDRWFLPERNGWFTLSQAIDTLGLNSEVEEALAYIFEPDLTDDEYNNLLLMLRAILSVETSGWWNIAHNTWASSADGYFQYLTQNGRYEGEDWLTNSYETALRSLSTELVNAFPVFESERWKIESDVASQIVSNLNTSEQIILFLSDITRNGRIEVIRNFLQDPSRENFISIYKLHHTNLSDEDTNRVLAERLDWFFE